MSIAIKQTKSGVFDGPFQSVNKTYRIDSFENLVIEALQPVSSFPLPENPDRENYLVKAEGNTTVINISFILVKRASTETSPYVGTVSPTWTSPPAVDAEPIKHLQYLLGPNGLQADSMNDAFEFYMDSTDSPDADGPNASVTSYSTPSYAVQGFLRRIQFQFDKNSPVNPTVSMDFIVGNNIATLDKALGEES